MSILLIDYYLNIILSNYVDVEADKVISVVVNQAIQKTYYDSSNFLLIKRDNDNNIENISYNTGELSFVKKQLLSMLENEIKSIEMGHYDDIYFASQENGKKKYPDIKYGYLCEINNNALHGSVLFGNVGPSIPLKLSFLNFLQIETDVNVREYGLNSVMIEIDAVIDVTILVTMPLSSRRHTFTVREPLSVEIINGKIPNYYFGHSS